jgi:hypothetical protein
MAVSLVFIPLSIWFPAFLYMTFIAWAVIFLSATPFSAKTYKVDKLVGLLSPGMIFLRALAFATGSLLAFSRPKQR